MEVFKIPTTPSSYSPPQPFCSNRYFFTSILNLSSATEESQEYITNRLQEIQKLLISKATSFRCHIFLLTELTTDDNSSASKLICRQNMQQCQCQIYI
jgi:hypothetical protein